MRKYLSWTLLFAASLAAVPAIPVIIGRSGADNAAKKVSKAAKDGIYTAEVHEDEPYRVLDVSTGEVIEVSPHDYVVGAVCAEMPATFEEEALKAQAAAAHTYAERQRMRERKEPHAELCGADFSNDTTKYQGYFTENQAKQYYGENFDMNYKKITKAAEEVLDYVITYEDEPIIPAFHSMSAGTTESAENMWGAAVDYLVPVESSFDTEAPKYLSEVKYERDVLKNELETAFPDISAEGEVSEWVKPVQTSASGTVLTAEVCGKAVTGSELRNALSLRSACFTVKAEGDALVFTTKGFGHCVGMSQYGANAMAAQGSTWQEILMHYYPGCEIRKLEIAEKMW